MAKTRVYELARDLNMTNKILLSKLSNMDISVKSHMSSLDDEAVSKVKTQLFGKKEEAIEETRIKPTVIRRRRKKVQVEVVPEPAVEPDVIAAAEETAEEPSEEKEIDKQAVDMEKVPEVAEEKADVELKQVEEKPAKKKPEDETAPAVSVKKPITPEDKKPLRKRE